MVRTKSRPHVRPKGAGPARRPKRTDRPSRVQGSGPPRTRKTDEEETLDERRYPNLAARRDMDRVLHVKAARAMGATRKQASRHASEEVGGH